MWSRSKFTSHYAGGTNGVCECKMGCKVYMDSYLASNGPCFVLTWFLLKEPPLGGRPNTKPGDHGTLNAHNRWFILFYYVWGYAWIEIHRNSIWLRTQSHMTSHYTWGSITKVHDYGSVFGHFLLGSHNFIEFLINLNLLVTVGCRLKILWWAQERVAPCVHIPPHSSIPPKYGWMATCA